MLQLGTQLAHRRAHGKKRKHARFLALCITRHSPGALCVGGYSHSHCTLHTGACHSQLHLQYCSLRVLCGLCDLDHGQCDRRMRAYAPAFYVPLGITIIDHTQLRAVTWLSLMVGCRMQTTHRAHARNLRLRARSWYYIFLSLFARLMVSTASTRTRNPHPKRMATFLAYESRVNPYVSRSSFLRSRPWTGGGRVVGHGSRVSS